MAKGIHSKRLQKVRALKRNVVRNTIRAENFERLGRLHYSVKNAFLTPNDPNAMFPQRRPPRYIDFRSETIEPVSCPVRSIKWKLQRPDPVQAADVEMKGEPTKTDDEINLSELSKSLAKVERTVKKAKARASTRQATRQSTRQSTR